jgi:hypothetical protein
VANYDDILTSHFLKQREILVQEFSKRGEFYDLVVEISQEMFKLRGRTISRERLEAGSLYILQELPLFLDGVYKIGSEVAHTVILYPGLGKLDELIMKILHDDGFESLREKLNIRGMTGVANVQ